MQRARATEQRSVLYTRITAWDRAEGERRAGGVGGPPGGGKRNERKESEGESLRPAGGASKSEARERGVRLCARARACVWREREEEKIAGGSGSGSSTAAGGGETTG